MKAAATPIADLRSFYCFIELRLRTTRRYLFSAASAERYFAESALAATIMLMLMGLMTMPAALYHSSLPQTPIGKADFEIAITNDSPMSIYLPASPRVTENRASAASCHHCLSATTYHAQPMPRLRACATVAKYQAGEYVIITMAFRWSVRQERAKSRRAALLIADTYAIDEFYLASQRYHFDGRKILLAALR